MRPAENFKVLKVAIRYFSINKVDLVGMLDTVEMVDNMDMVEKMNMVDSRDILKGFGYL